MDKLEIGIVILAAGTSLRMGQPKQMLAINGQALLVRSVNVALKSEAKKIVVVLGANAFEHKELLKNFPVEIIFNKDWQLGMGNSIKAGVRYAIQIFPALEAIIIMVCDQPLLHPDHINKLMNQYLTGKNAIVASFYDETYGVPVLFAKQFFNDLQSLEDSYGAKKIIQKYNNDVAGISFPKGVIDLDTPEDYNAFIDDLKE